MYCHINFTGFCFYISQTKTRSIWSCQIIVYLLTLVNVQFSCSLSFYFLCWLIFFYFFCWLIFCSCVCVYVKFHQFWACSVAFQKELIYQKSRNITFLQKQMTVAVIATLFDISGIQIVNITDRKGVWDSPDRFISYCAFLIQKWWSPQFLNLGNRLLRNVALYLLLCSQLRNCNCSVLKCGQPSSYQNRQCPNSKFCHAWCVTILTVSPNLLCTVNQYLLCLLGKTSKKEKS